jgi:hypothetical protein
MLTASRVAPCLAALLGLLPLASAQAESRLGAGIHYWTTIDDLDDEGIDIDEEGTSFLLSYQYVPAGLFKFEADLEYFSDGFGGGDSEAFAPQAFILLGGALYGGLGIGVVYNDDLEDEWSDPFYTARAGIDLEVLPKIHLDLNARYQFEAFNQLDEADTDAITLGLIGRIALN